MTHAELAARLLRDAADLFRNVGGRDTEAAERIERFSALYLRAADLVETDPEGNLDPAFVK